MIAEIVCVGTELLMGQVLNTDAKFISSRLADLGVNLYYQVTVGDNPKRLRDTLKTALDRSDVVITSGGLGPTGDDLTKETAAELLGLTLEYDPASLKMLEDRFRAFGKEMTPNNLKQAMFPKESIILSNPNGTAPGCIMEKDGKAIILLPGPPRELFPMFTDSVMPYLEKRSNTKLYSRVLRIFGMGESTLEHTLKDLIEAQTNPTIAPYALLSEVTLRITARCKDEEEGESLIAPVIAEIKSRIGDVIYSFNDEPLEKVCANLLTEHHKTLAVAESCTGGMIASTLVGIPGSSKWFLEGAVTYSNEAKMRRLGVSEATLRQYGAVSYQTAIEMAEGMRRTSGSDYAIATTGIAGPDGGTKEKPVGLVYIAIAAPDGTEVKEFYFTGDRSRIRHSTMLNALDFLRRKF